MNNVQQVWYCQREGKTSGPYELKKLQEWADLGHVKSTDLLRKADSKDWRPAHHQLAFSLQQSSEQLGRIPLRNGMVEDVYSLKTKLKSALSAPNRRLGILLGTLGVLLIIAISVFTGDDTTKGIGTTTDLKKFEFGQRLEDTSEESKLKAREFNQFAPAAKNNNDDHLDVQAARAYGEGDYVSAVELYTQLIKSRPNSDLAYINRGKSYYQIKEYQKACDDFGSTDQTGNDPAAITLHGLASIEIGEIDEAVFIFTSAIKLDSTISVNYNNRGYAYARKAEYNTAIKDYLKALELDGMNLTALFNLGDAQIEVKEFGEAIATYSKLIGLSTDNYHAYYRRGLGYHWNGQYGRAVEDYTKAIAISPNAIESFINRAIAQRNLGEVEKANSDIKRARILGYDGEIMTIQVTKQPASTSPSMNNTNASQNTSVALPDVVKQLERGVVTVQTDLGVGTGFLIDDSGIITTNHHVVEGAQEIKVQFGNGLVVEVDGMLGAYPGYDTVFLKIKLPKGGYPKALSLVQPNHVIEKAQEIYVIGAPHGNEFSFVKGYVVKARSGAETISAWKRIDRVNFNYDVNCPWIEHDTRVDSGNSGSPLMDASGNVLAMHTLSLRSVKNVPYRYAVDGRVFGELLAKAGKTIKPIAQIPKNVPPVVTLPKTVVVNGFNDKISIKGSIEQFNRLYKRRSDLLDYQYEIAEQISKLQYRYKSNENKFSQNRVAYNSNLQSINRYNSLLRSTQNVSAQSSYQSSIRNLASANQIIVGYQQEIQTANQEISSYINKWQSELTKTSSLLYGIRKDWVRLVDPFGSFKKGDVNIAFNEFNEWVRLDPKFYLAYLGRGMVFGHKGDFTAAHNDLNYATSLLSKKNREELAEVHSSHAMICIMEQDIRKAMEYANRAITAQSKLALPHAVKGVGFFNFGNFGDAQTSFKRAIVANAGKENLYLHINYAAFLCMCPDGKFRDAEKSLEQARIAYRLGGGVNADCAFILAAAFAENNDAKNAAHFCNIAIAQQPEATTQNEWEQIKILFSVNKKVRYTPSELVGDD